MGYSTDFKGSLLFTQEATGQQLKALKAMMEEDCREHPEWGASKEASYIDLELNDDFSGLQWNGAEKTRAMVECVNIILNEMRKQWPDFGLTGTLVAQGESLEDRWALTIENGVALKKDIHIAGIRAECPNCAHKFIIEEAAK